MLRDLKQLGLGLVPAAAIALSPNVAQADASSWAFAGAGALAWKDGSEPLAPRAALSFDMGVGTNPDGRFIVGGLFRLMPVIDVGLDAALLGRVATHGFQAGGLGLALDVGAYQRTYGSFSRGITGGITLGLPLGLSIGLQGLYGTEDAMAFGAMAGIDVLRLTVYRQVFLDAWPNPYPAHHAPPASAFVTPARFF